MVAKLKRKNLIDEGRLDIDFGLTVKADEFFMERQKFDAGFIGVVGINNDDLTNVCRSAFSANKFDVGFNGLVGHGEHSLIN